MKVILISGHAGHGKDTVAIILQEQLQVNDENKVLITHYADLLKYICTTFFDWDGKKNREGRTLLQHVGTYVREKEPNFWVDFVADLLCFFDDRWDFVIIPDTRFQNEINRLKERGIDTVHLRVVRPNFVSYLTTEQQKHPSETSLDDTEPDYCIINSGDLDTLKSKITEYITGVLYDKKR